jgi:hypothetical protein
MENTVFLTVFLLLIVGYVVLYIWGRKYLENFEDKPTMPVPIKKGDTMTLPTASLMPENKTRPVDEYELSAVFKNQGSREATQQQINDAMTRYPLDWSTHGPDSQYFQEQQNAYQKNKLPQPEAYYGNLDGVKDALTDTASQEEEERKILQTYQPKSSKGLLQYSVDDVKSLLHKVYDKKGLIPVVAKSKQGPNIWEVIEVKEKNPHIVWEDEISNANTAQAQDMRMEERITVPYPASDLAANMDPFMRARESTRKGASHMDTDLERMFDTVKPVPAWK